MDDRPVQRRLAVRERRLVEHRQLPELRPRRRVGVAVRLLTDSGSAHFHVCVLAGASFD